MWKNLNRPSSLILPSYSASPHSALSPWWLQRLFPCPSWGEEPPSSSCSAQLSPAGCWPGPQGHVTGSRSSWCARGLLCKAVVPPRVQDFAFLLSELHEMAAGLFLQPGEVPLKDSTASWWWAAPLNFTSPANLLWVPLCPSARQHWRGWVVWVLVCPLGTPLGPVLKSTPQQVH